MYSLAPQYITPRGPETQTNTATDGSMSVYGYVTISYNRQAYTQTIDKFLLTEVEGGWEIEDHSVIIKDRRVVCACYDLVPSPISEFKPTSNTFSYTTGYTTYAIDNSTSCIVGAFSEATLSRRANLHDWIFRVEANAVSNNIVDGLGYLVGGRN